MLGESSLAGGKLCPESKMSPGEEPARPNANQNLLHGDTDVLSSLPAHLGCACLSPGHFVLCRRGQEVTRPRPRGLMIKKKKKGNLGRELPRAQGPRPKAEELDEAEPVCS